MSDEYTDPSGNTAQFQAFADRTEEPAPTKRPQVGLIVIGVAMAVVVIAIVAFLLVS